MLWVGRKVVAVGLLSVSLVTGRYVGAAEAPATSDHSVAAALAAFNHLAARIDALHQTQPQKWSALQGRIDTAKQWMEEHPPQTPGDLDPQNVGAGFRVTTLSKREAQKRLVKAARAGRNHLVYRNSTARARGDVWLIEFPNYLSGGYETFVDDTSGRLLAVIAVSEG